MSFNNKKFSENVYSLVAVIRVNISYVQYLVGMGSYPNA